MSGPEALLRNVQAYFPKVALDVLFAVRGRD